MGKGQRLRREQEAAASAPPVAPPAAPASSNESFSFNAAAGSFAPGMGLVSPPAAPAVSVTPIAAPVASRGKVDYVSQFQETDSIEQFLARDEADRITTVEELLEQVRSAPTPTSVTPEPKSGVASVSTSGKLKASQSVQSIQSLTKSTSGLSLNAQSRSSTSLQELNKTSSSTDTSFIESVVFDLTAIIRGCGISSLEGHRILMAMREQVLSDDKTEKGLLLLKSLLTLVGRGVEPFVLSLVGRVLQCHADRMPGVRALAVEIADLMADMLCSFSIVEVYGMLSPVLTDTDIDWRVKVAALNFLKNISPRVSGLISNLLPQIIPQVSECIIDTRKAVQSIAIEALTAACSAIHNDDIVHLVPQLIRVIAVPNDSPMVLDLLLETTFVSTVDAPTLALIAPLLNKTLKGRLSPLKRKAARVIENMIRLVNNPLNAMPFVPLLLPSLNRVIEEVTDEEVCAVATAARNALLKAINADPSDVTASNVTIVEKVDTLNIDHSELKSIVEKIFEDVLTDEEAKYSLKTTFSKEIVEYMASNVVHLLDYQSSVTDSQRRSAGGDDEDSKAEVWRVVLSYTSIDNWKDCMTHYLKDLTSKENCENIDLLTELAMTLRKKALGTVRDKQLEEESDDTSLCNIYFSLAFGGKTLLHNTYLRLGRGKRYGIMGKNGTGKTTLLTNIANNNIEGLPTTLRTVYVQHDDSSDDFGISLVDELMANPNIIAIGTTREEAVSALKAIYFTDEMLASPRNSLSGGWKMKLLIIRAMLLKADVLLLDEPTNHLDADSVHWLGSYLLSQKDLTCMIVSHDTAFLDRVVTDVIHYEQRKLVYYHGTLSHFVTLHPEAKYYFDLESSSLRFTFPIPERLEGINSTTKTVLKLEDVTFTYPNASKPTIRNANVKLCLGSRVAVLGPNGAGKSTLIKLIVKETEPDLAADGESRMGEVWKHPNLRIAYVAQHSLHHVEQHLEKSPVDYIKWRFEKGYDKEDFEKAALKITEEEAESIKAERQYGDVVEIFGRRKNGRTMEYECSFVGQTQFEDNKYFPLEELIAKGFEKLVQQADTRIAAMAAGLDVRPLLIKEIQKHLDDFNLESEFGTHSKIRRLSGGQKVKLVLASAMWNRPHIIVLDEPTNYLDREAMGALTQAIKEFHGGIVVISHNAEFTKSICTEQWVVKDGQVYVEGEVQEKAVKATSSRKLKAENKALETPSSEKTSKVGNINGSIVSQERIKNPKTFEFLKPVEVRKLTKLATTAGLSLKDYMAKMTPASPEWKWL